MHHHTICTRTFSLVITLAVLLLSAQHLTGQAAATTPNCGSWGIISSPNLMRNDSLTSVAAISSSDVWAVGQAYKTYFSKNSQTLTEHWNGSQWSVVPSLNPNANSGLLSVTTISNSDVWAVGFAGTKTLTEHWNGSAWNVVASPSAGQTAILDGVSALSTNNIWAVGYITNNNGKTSQTLVEHWNGTRWSIVSSPNVNNGDDFYAVTTIAANDIWAVGDANGTPALIEHWDGTQWKIVKNPVIGSGDVLYSVAALATNNVWAVGYSIGYKSYKTLVEHWDGMRWSTVPIPNPGSPTIVLTGVTVLSANNIWIVGLFRSPHNPLSALALTEHWDGTKWSVVQSPHPTGALFYPLNAVARVPGTSSVWAVGQWQHESDPIRKTLTEFYC